MAIYLCSVANKFPENYQIGIQAGVWGVQEKYEKRILHVKRGDYLVFYSGGEFRSIHLI